MEFLNYTRRCKNKTGDERYNTLHASDNNETFCGKKLNEMWFIELSAELAPEDVTCVKCRQAMRSTKR